MAKNTPWTAVLVLTLIVAAYAAPAAAQSFDEEVERMIDGVVEAWNGHDPDALAEMFTEDADLRDQNGLWVVGRDEIHRYFAEWMENSDGAKEVHVDRARLIAEGAAAVDVISAVVPKGGTFWGEETQRLAVSVQVLQQPDGSWLFSSWRQCGSAK